MTSKNSRHDMQHIWEKYTGGDVVEENSFADTIYRVDLYNGHSQLLLMDEEIAEDLKHMEGPKNGAAMVWMGEEYMYLKPNKPQ